MGRAAIAALFMLALTALACGKKDTYRPIYYPDRSNLTVYTRGPTFDNLAQARQWAQDQHQQRRDPNWDYEVGKNCRPLRDDSDMEVCEETLR
jgi:hypothetical protein